jgi:hypothetical protein
MTAKDLIVCDGCGREGDAPLPQGWRQFAIDLIPDGGYPMLARGNTVLDGNRPAHLCTNCVRLFTQFFHDIKPFRPIGARQ